MLISEPLISTYWNFRWNFYNETLVAPRRRAGPASSQGASWKEGIDIGGPVWFTTRRVEWPPDQQLMTQATKL